MVLLGGLTGDAAVLVANWKNGSATATAVAGANTDSPSFGDGTASNAQSSWPVSLLGTTTSPFSYTLGQVGDHITVSGSVVLTSGAGPDSDYRFGLFNDFGGFASNTYSGWNGYLLQGTTIFRGRTNGPFVSTLGDAVNLGATVLSNTGSLAKDSATPLDFSMTVRRTGATALEISASLVGGGGNLDRRLLVTDNGASNFTFTAHGWLFGSASQLDQAQFSGVVASPEPAVPLLGAMGVVALVAVRRRPRPRA